MYTDHLRIFDPSFNRSKSASRREIWPVIYSAVYKWDFYYTSLLRTINPLFEERNFCYTDNFYMDFGRPT